MVSMGQFSRELCGGTHVTNTREVDAFEIVSEESVSAGTRRVVALTGDKAKDHAQQIQATLQATAELLGVSLEETLPAVRDLVQQARDLRKQLTSGAASASEPSSEKETVEAMSSYESQRAALRDTARLLNVAPLDVPARVASLRKEVEQLREQVAELSAAGVLSADSLIERGVTMGNVLVVVCETPGANTNLMRQLIDQIRKKSPQAAVLLASAQGADKVTVVAGLTRAVTDLGADAGRWVRQVAAVLGGGGGGRADMAQAGGRFPDKLPEALAEAERIIRNVLEGTRG
jgi:alanyl-tRNA synthetase